MSTITAQYYFFLIFVVSIISFILQRELCSINKPGKAAISSSIVLHATKIATERASVLHGILNTALQQLETDVILERSVRLDKLRIFSNTINNDPSKNNFVNGNVVDGTVICVGDSVGVVAVGGGGIDRDDPMLAWTSLHQAAGLRETE